MDHELDQLRQSFGDTAEPIYRGLCVARDSVADLADALTLVLRVRDKLRLGETLDAVELDVARAIDPRAVGASSTDAVEDLRRGPLGRLTTDVSTTLGVFRQGAHVHVLDRVADDQLLVRVLDLDRSVVWISEAEVEHIG